MYKHNKPDNLVEMIENSIQKYTNNPLFGTKNTRGTYDWTTYKEVGQRIDNLRGGLAQLGVGKGDVVGIIANNRVEWAIAAFASFGIGGRYIPMYEKELVKIWQYIINDGNVKVLLVATPEIYDKINQIREELPFLEKIFLIDGDGENTMSELEQTGRAHPVSAIHPDPNDIAVLIYTSGTTGNPKGVLLSHGNLTSNIQAGCRLFPQLDEHSRSLSILPWAHSFGQSAELYNFIQLGGSIGFIENITTIAEDMAQVRPSFLIAVPRIFYKIYDGIWEKLDEAGGLVKKLFIMGIKCSNKRRGLAEKNKSSTFTNLLFKFVDALFFKKIRDKFGGRLEGSLSGSATMNIEIAQFFFAIGIPVYDCYGLTETSPAVTMNCPASNKLGSVGRPIENVRVVIDRSVGGEDSKDGEIIVYGPNVMHGYHNNPEDTNFVMTGDRGLRTGDLGWLDEEGFLYITGRIKEQYKLENGKYVFPASLEEEIRLVPYVENTMLYGEGKAYNICLIVPNFQVLEKYAKKNNLPIDPDQLIKRKDVKKLICDAIVESLEGKYKSYEIPKKFIFLVDNFSLASGALTQTMKLKRDSVTQQYKKEIEDIYQSPR